MNNDKNVMVNVWGVYLLIFFMMDIVFELGKMSIYIYALLLSLIVLYCFTRVIKKVYIKADYIVAWTLLSLISLVIPYILRYFNIESECLDDLCINSSRFYFYVLMNLAMSALMFLNNILILPFRMLTKKTM